MDNQPGFKSKLPGELLAAIEQHPDLPRGATMKNIDDIKKDHRSVFRRLKKGLFKSSEHDKRDFSTRWSDAKVFFVKSKPDLADLIEQFQTAVRKPWRDGE